jgi:hypothetical protein
VSTTIAELLDSFARDLRPVEELIRSHSFVAAAESGRAPSEALRAFAAEQDAVLRSDHQSFLHLAKRFGRDPSGSFFERMAAGELEALEHLGRLATALELDAEALATYRHQAGAQAYPAFVAWLALQGSRLDVALAFLVNLDAWGASCVRLGRALREHYGLDAGATGFFAYFAPPGPELRGQLLDVAAAGLADGDDPTAARRAARLLQAYELLFWDSLA